MSAERAVAHLRPAEAVLRQPEAAPAAVAVPPHIVAAIAQAAVAAYIEAKREEARAYQRAYYRVNRDELLRKQAARRAARRPHAT